MTDLNSFFLNTAHLNSKVNFFIQTLYHRTTTYTLTQHKGTTEIISCKLLSSSRLIFAPISHSKRPGDLKGIYAYKYVQISDGLFDGLFDRQKTMDFKRYLLLLLHHFAIDRANNRSFLISSPISAEQKRSPHILPESRAFKNQSPHISPTTRAEFVCKVPIMSPYSPTSARGPPPWGSR